MNPITFHEFAELCDRAKFIHRAASDLCPTVPLTKDAAIATASLALECDLPLTVATLFPDSALCLLLGSDTGRRLVA